MLWLIIVILVFVAIGVIGALPALLPLVHRRATENRTFRLWLGLGLALLPILITFALIARTSAALDIIVTSEWTCGFDGQTCSPNVPEPNDALNHDLTLRHLFPPPFKYHCFSGDAAACALADDVVEGRSYAISDSCGLDGKNCVERISWSGYLTNWLFALIPGAVTFFMVRRLTRDNRKQKRE